jgi:drug/metabolite transporter (DMT)-like permease
MGLKDDHFQLIGLIGFIVAGMVFVAVGINFGDTLTIIGSVIWILSCLVWMIPLIRSRQG